MFDFVVRHTNNVKNHFTELSVCWEGGSGIHSSVPGIISKWINQLKVTQHAKNLLICNLNNQNLSFMKHHKF